jgi:hypothetical protein
MPLLTKEPNLLLNDDNAGKPESINLMMAGGPTQRLENSDGDLEMLDYTEVQETLKRDQHENRLEDVFALDEKD